MILDQPVNSAAIRAMTDAEKMALAKQAYAEFLEIIHHIGEEQRQLLDKVIADMEQKKIEEIKAAIQAYKPTT